MLFIELNLLDETCPILFNIANIASICAIRKGRGDGTMITIDGEEYCLVKESYEEVKRLIINAQKDKS